MSAKTPRSWDARVYALLLHLYPEPFRREYGDSMLQLFDDQRRRVRGAGGHAMLWLKIFRDLLRSVPDVRSGAARAPAIGARFLWTVVVVLGLVFLLNAVVLPSWVGRVPSADAPVAAQSAAVALPAQYRAVGQAAAGIVSTLLAVAAFLFAARRSAAAGLAAFIAGSALTLMALAMNPWLWLAADAYPVGVAWAIGIWPLAAAAWIALVIARRQHVSGT